MKKYYILKRNNEELANSYLNEFSGKKRESILKRRFSNKELILIEKTIYKDDTEKYTDMWFLDESSCEPWNKITKGKQMYDYTGVVYPLIHENGTVLTFKQYTELQK